MGFAIYFNMKNLLEKEVIDRGKGEIFVLAKGLWDFLKGGFKNEVFKNLNCFDSEPWT
jgi:hypothetical protein